MSFRQDEISAQREQVARHRNRERGVMFIIRLALFIGSIAVSMWVATLLHDALHSDWWPF